MPTAKKNGSKSGKSASPPKRKKVNRVDLEALRAEFDEVHEILDKQESRNARDRGAIAKIYERGSAALGLSKKVIISTFGAERKLKKALEKARANMDGEDRDGFLQIASAFGDTTPLGAWAQSIADAIPAKVEEDEGEEGEGAEATKVVQLHGPAR